MEFAIKGRFIYQSSTQMNLTFLEKLKMGTNNMLEIKREQLWILTTNLVHVKTGTIIVTCNEKINRNLLNYAVNKLDKKMLLLFQNKV